MLRVANEPRFADLPPARIVPILADVGVYIASESTFCRVLREHGQAAAARAGTDDTHCHSAGRGVVLGHDLSAGPR